MKWLDNTLIRGPYITLVCSQKECDAAFRHCKVPKNDIPPWINNDHSDATVHTLEGGDKGLAFVVAIRPKSDTSALQIAGLLVHESVHIWQHWREHIGEKNPSYEFEAYSIQAISQTLMTAYAERVT